MSNKKRDDIQWLRTVAIISVLCFHIWPKNFPLGYLGVDVFFVISGYLMSMILYNSKSSVTNFYIRRINRIVPTCAFVLMVFTILFYFVLLQFHYTALLSEALWSIFFVNNLAPIVHHQDYFEMLSEFKFFVHTWSLGVEVQFYLIAPFVLKFFYARQQPLIWVVITMVASAMFQVTIPSKEVAFGFMLCRMWQFLSGTAAFLCSTKNDQKSTSATKYGCFLGLLLILCFSPYHIDSNLIATSICRLLSTVLAAALLNIETTVIVSSRINQMLVYIGNASYSMYLVHWPLIVIFNYLGVKNDPAMICLIFVLSFAVHELFEKPMTNISWQANAKFSSVCYAVIIFLFFLQNTSILTTDTNQIVDDPIRQNELEALSCQNVKKTFYSTCADLSYNNQYFFESLHNENFVTHCSFDLDSKSNKTAVILGNSFAYFQIQGLLEGIRQAKTKFNKVFVLIYRRCNQLVGNISYSLNDRCQKVENDYKLLLAELKPDAIVFSSRFCQLSELRQKILQDKKTQLIQEQINLGFQVFTSFTPKFIIIEPPPSMWPPTGYQSPYSAAQALLAKKNINRFKMDIKFYNSKEPIVWKWIQPAIDKCKNCIVVPTKDLFCDKSSCYLVNPKTKIAQYCDSAHTTPRESLKFVSRLIKAIDS